MRKILTFSLIIIAGMNSITAQAPVITAATNNPQLNQTFVYQLLLPATAPVAGASGANVSWDFSSLAAGDRDTLNFISPASSPCPSAFPLANIVRYSTKSKSFTYLKAGSTSLEEIGNYAVLSSDTIKNLNSKVLFNYPFNFTNSLQDTFTNQKNSQAFPGGTYKIEYDAYGTLKLPGKTYTNAMRMKISTNDSLLGPLIASVNGYNWFISGSPEPVLSIYTIYLNGSVFSHMINYLENDITGIQHFNTSVNNVNLYPNPASNDANLIYSLEKNGFTTINIYNSLGETVNTIVNQNQTQGYYAYPLNLTGLSSGMYSINITSEGNTITKKLIIE